MKEKIIIQCEYCEWKPDGGKHWTCTCKHTWNTFETKGKCPNCGIQWKETSCIGCKQSSPHKNWYKTEEEVKLKEVNEDGVLKARKRRIETQLIDYGIIYYRISHLPYLDYTNERFKTPYEIGCRILILYSINYCIHNLKGRKSIIEWLKLEKLWDKVSPIEKYFLEKRKPEERILINLSWKIESALVLGWAVGLIDKLPRLDDENSTQKIEELVEKLPRLGNKTNSILRKLNLIGVDNKTKTSKFLNRLKLRKLEEIYEENILNELVTSYFRDLVFSGDNDETQINRAISFERHIALNWLRNFSGIEEWDETDTST